VSLDSSRSRQEPSRGIKLGESYVMSDGRIVDVEYDQEPELFGNSEILGFLGAL